MDAYVFYVSRPRRLRTGAFQFEIASASLKVYGPFDTHAQAESARRGLEARWRRRASALGGEFEEASPTEWVVRVPSGTPVRGLPYDPVGSAGPPKGRDPRDDPPLKLRARGWKIR